MRSLFRCSRRIAVIIIVLAVLIAASGCSFDPLSTGADVKNIPSYDENSELITKKSAVRIAKSQIPDKGRKKVLEVHEAEEEEYYIVYKGQIQCGDMIFCFAVESSAGNIISWKVKSALK